MEMMEGDRRAALWEAAGLYVRMSRRSDGSGGWLIADCKSSAVAAHIVDLHNQWAAAFNKKADETSDGDWDYSSWAGSPQSGDDQTHE